MIPDSWTIFSFSWNHYKQSSSTHLAWVTAIHSVPQCSKASSISPKRLAERFPIGSGAWRPALTLKTTEVESPIPHSSPVKSSRFWNRTGPGRLQRARMIMWRWWKSISNQGSGEIPKNTGRVWSPSKKLSLRMIKGPILNTRWECDVSLFNFLVSALEFHLYWNIVLLSWMYIFSPARMYAMWQMESLVLNS